MVAEEKVVEDIGRRMETGDWRGGGHKEMEDYEKEESVVEDI